MENAISLQRENIIETRPLVPPNDCIMLIRRFRSMARSSSRIRSDAIDTVMGSIDSRAGSIAVRQHGHVFFVFNDFSKHVVQKVWPHAVTETLTFPGISKHTAHVSVASASAVAASASALGWSGGGGEGEGEGDCCLHKYCIVF